MDKEQKEICSIRIIFPVESDELALVIKSKIKDVLADNPDAQIQFSIMSGMLRSPIPPT